MVASFAMLHIGAPEFVLIVVLLAILYFEVWMFVDAIRNQHIARMTKLWWIIGMVLLHPLVAIAYYFTDHKKAQ